MLNAIGLQNCGVDVFLDEKLPRLPWRETPIVANLYACDADEFAELAGVLAEAPGVAALEVNISCPNVKAGGIAFGQDPSMPARQFTWESTRPRKSTFFHKCRSGVSGL